MSQISNSSTKLVLLEQDTHVMTIKLIESVWAGG